MGFDADESGESPYRQQYEYHTLECHASIFQLTYSQRSAYHLGLAFAIGRSLGAADL